MSKDKDDREAANSKQETQNDTAQTLLSDKKGDAKSEAHNSDVHDTDNQWVRLWEFFKQSSATDWLLALFTAGLFATAIYQFILLNGQLDVMRQDERAWLTTTLTSVSQKDLIIGKQMSAQVKIANTGKTPAFFVTCRATIDVVKENDTPAFKLKLDDPELGMPNVSRVFAGEVTPNAVAYPMEVTSVAPLTKVQKDSLDSGKAWLMVHGIAVYYDVFKQSHWVSFCGWQGFVANRTYRAGSCTAHNLTDEYQKYYIQN